HGTQKLKIIVKLILIKLVPVNKPGIRRLQQSCTWQRYRITILHFFKIRIDYRPTINPFHRREKSFTTSVKIILVSIRSATQKYSPPFTIVKFNKISMTGGGNRVRT